MLSRDILVSTVRSIVEPSAKGGGLNAFGVELKRLRDARGWSQMELSGEAEVSTRHLSFLETGRARPSREMVQRLGSALDLPYRMRNELLVSAGFAPVYAETGLDDTRMTQVLRSLEFLLENHEPFPAFVLGRTWDILLGNRAHHMMLAELQSGLGFPAEEPQNALRLVLAPDRLRPIMRNWRQVARAVMMRLERQVRLAAGDTMLDSLLSEMLAYPDVRDAVTEPWSADEQAAILVPMRFDLGDRELSWFTTIAGFGGALDVTTQEVVIESLLPADEATRRFAMQVGAA